MTNEIPTQRIIEALQYLLETSGEHFATESGLRPEFQEDVRRGYDTALEHIAYALDLPEAVHQVVDESLPVYRRLRTKFPAA